MPSMLSPLGRYHKTTRSWPAAALLQQIAYWWPKAKITRDGHTWIAKSRQAWCDETDLTPKEYKSAVQKLRQLRLVATEQHRFAGEAVTHLRLTRAGRTLVKPEAPTGPPGQAPGGPPGKAPGGPPHIQGITDKNYEQKEESELALAGSPCGDSFKKDSGKEKEDSMNVKEILEKQIHKPQHEMTLVILWQSVVAEIDETFVPSFTNAQRGQLKQFAKKCPPGKAEPVLEHALRHWLIFTESVEADVGVYKPPARPEVGFLLQHAGVAVNLALPKPKPKVLKPKPAPVPLTAAKPSEPEKEPPPLPTWEEAHAFFYPEATKVDWS